MDRLLACEKQLFREQMAQRDRDAPMISIVNSRTGVSDVLRTVELEPCDVGNGCKRTPLSLATIGSGAVRHYNQVFVDRTSRRVAPIFVVDTGCSDRRKRRRLASEIVVVLRHFEEGDKEERGGDEGERLEARFSLADVDEEEARQQQESDNVVLQTAKRLTESCGNLQTEQQSARLVRHLLDVKKTILPLLQHRQEKKDALLLRRAVLLRALIDSEDFTLLRFSPVALERETGVVLARFSTRVTQETVLNVLAMLLELANPQTDLARLVDIAHCRPHYDGKGATWLLTEQGKTLLRPEIASFSDYAAAVVKK